MVVAGFDDDRRFLQKSFGRDIDAVTSCLAEAAADAFVGDQQRSELPRAFDWLTEFIDLCPDGNKLKRVVAGGRAFVDAELAGFAEKRKAR